jgi:23S rRNA C2498 (ribose-2'-O)-methylase RlmM
VTSVYFYCLVNPGFEARLKAEAQAHEPSLRFSFSRPGFVTFKSETDRRAPNFTFARLSGRFLAKGNAEAAASAAASWQEQTAGPSVVHRFSLAQGTGTGDEASAGAKILDVVEVLPGEFWWGERTAHSPGWSAPGGVPELVLAEDAPSRAWLKLEEMLLWSGWSPDGTVLELGSAPGGASWALLNRGVSVVGLDVAPMTEACLNHPRYRHLAMSVRDLRKKDLPERVDALFCDLGLKPVEAVPQLRTICQWYPSIKRLYYTLKMGEGQTEEQLDGWRAQIEKMGFKVRSTHLPSNRMEILVYGVRNP